MNYCYRVLCMPVRISRCPPCSSTRSFFSQNDSATVISGVSVSFLPVVACAIVCLGSPCPAIRLLYRCGAPNSAVCFEYLTARRLPCWLIVTSHRGAHCARRHWFAVALVSRRAPSGRFRRSRAPLGVNAPLPGEPACSSAVPSSGPTNVFRPGVRRFARAKTLRRWAFGG